MHERKVGSVGSVPASALGRCCVEKTDQSNSDHPKVVQEGVMRLRRTYHMRNKKSAAILTACLFSLGVVILFSLKWKQWVTVAQSGENNLMVLTPTFQFNVLKQPRGLLALDKTVSAGGPNYTTEFHLYISDSGNHLIGDFNNSTSSASRQQNLVVNEFSPTSPC